MSIIKAYNKANNTYYAYHVTYVWDEKRNKKVPKRICIGHYDLRTGEIVPNGKRGRRRKSATLDTMGEEKALTIRGNIEMNTKLNTFLEETQLIKLSYQNCAID